MADAARAEARKVALVVANATYVAADVLQNPPNDAELVAEAARRAGFEVVAAADLTKSEFDAQLRDFRRKADGAEVALIYYAGHGVENAGQNYLLPVDAKLSEARDLAFEAVALDLVLQNVAGAKRQVVIIDACRENPFGVSWVGGKQVNQRGLAQNQAAGALIIYAASQGQFAIDGEGTNSPFAAAVARWLPEPGLQLQLLGGRISDDVFEATARRQRPWTYSGMGGEEYFLVPQSGALASAHAAGGTEDVDGLRQRLERVERLLAAAAPSAAAPTASAQPPAAVRTPPPSGPVASPAAGPVAARVRAVTAVAPPPAASQPPAGASAALAPPAAVGTLGSAAGAATLHANRSVDREPLPMMPATPAFKNDGYPTCREDFQTAIDMVARTTAINACLGQLYSYSTGPLIDFRNAMISHQRVISELYRAKVGGNDAYTEVSQQDFYRRMMREFAASNPDGEHFADHRATAERYAADRAYLEQQYCQVTQLCAGATPAP